MRTVTPQRVLRGGEEGDMAPQWERLHELILMQIFYYLNNTDRVAASEVCVSWSRVTPIRDLEHDNTTVRPQWDRLPDLILEQVFCFMSDNDRLVASKVCTSWRRVFTDSTKRLGHTNNTVDNNAPRWERLPDLILTQVFCYLGDHDRVAASEVCVSWSRALAVPSIWRRMVVHLDHDLFSPPDRREPLALGLARLFGQHVRQLELVWTRPYALPLRVIPKVSRAAQAEAGATFLALLRTRDVQLQELVLTDWVFSYKWGNRNKLLFALANFLGSQSRLETLSLQNACLSVCEALRLLAAVAHSCSNCLRTLDLRSAFREWQAPHASPRYLDLLGRLAALTQLRLDYPALSDDALLVLASTNCGTLRKLHMMVRDTDNRQHVLSDGAWQQLVQTCPGLRVLLVVVNIAHYEDISSLLAPAIPMMSFQLHSGSVWDQSRSRNFRSTVRLLLTQYAQTLEDVHLHLKNNREMLDDLLVEMLNQCHHLSYLQYDGVLRDMDTVRKICNLQLLNKTKFQTLHVRPRALNTNNRFIIKEICAEFVHKLAQKTVDFKIEDPSSVIMFC